MTQPVAVCDYRGMGKTGHARADAHVKQLAWLVSWDERMHAFAKDQEVPEFAVMAICGHISRPRSISKGTAVQCGGCLVAMGRVMAEDGAAWK